LIFDANRIAIDWVKLLRRSNLGKEERILLSTAGQPKNVHPNVRFDFGKSSAAVLGGFLESHECVTLESFSNEMPERAMSLRDLENHPLEWLDPGQYRMTIDLPWGRWTKRFRVGDRFDVVALPQAIGLEPLRNRFRSHDVFDPGLTRYYQLFGIRKSGGFHVWGSPATGVLIASIGTECGIRAAPFSKTSLREWDGLLTVGRLDIDDPAGFIRKLDGKVPDGTDEDFGLLALAAAYAAYDQESWPDLRTIIEIIDERAFNFFDVSLLKLAADVADGRLVERKQVIIDHLAYPHDYNPLPWLSPTEILGRTPILRWGVTLLQYLARQVNLPPPPWVYEIDLSSVVTLFNFDRWELSEEFWTKHAPIPEYLLPPGLLPSQSDLEKKA